MDDWAKKLAFARENGLVAVAFHPDGSLASFTRDPAFEPDGAQPKLSTEERETRRQQALERHRRVLLGATSGLRAVGPR